MKKIMKVKSIMFFTIICSISLLSYGTELDVEPVEIFFDYDQNSDINDALSVSDATETPVTWAEWNQGDQVSIPAYRKSRVARSVKVIFGDNYYNV